MDILLDRLLDNLGEWKALAHQHAQRAEQATAELRDAEARLADAERRIAELEGGTCRPS